MVCVASPDVVLLLLDVVKPLKTDGTAWYVTSADSRRPGDGGGSGGGWESWTGDGLAVSRFWLEPGYGGEGGPDCSNGDAVDGGV